MACDRGWLRCECIFDAPSLTAFGWQLSLRQRQPGGPYANIEMNCVGAVLLGRHARPRQGGEEPPSLWDARLERWTSLQRQPDDLAQSEADLAQSERWTSLQRQSDDLREEIEGPIHWTTTMRIPLDLVVDEILAPRPGDPSLPAAAVGTAQPAASAGHAAAVGPTDGEWRVGLFKCADDSRMPHWGSAFPIGEQLNFHQPELFGSLRFE